MTGLAAAQYSLENNISIDSAQSVDGTGFFSAYRYVNMPDPLGNLQGVAGQDLSGMAAKHLAHGSGKISENSRILAYSYYYEDGVIPVQDGVELEPIVDEENITSLPSIRIQEDTSMIYGPSTMALGRGYYAHNLISRASLPADRTCIKNLDTGSILHNEIEYARAFRKELEAYADYINQANTTMQLDETVTEGMARIGALWLEELPTIRESESDEDEILLIKKSKPLIETDEMYIGSFHLNKSMILAASVDKSDEDDADYDWLPCCSGGYLDMPINYQKGSKGFGSNVKGIFDCSCVKVSK